MDKEQRCSDPKNKKCVSEIDMNMVVKMFQNLKPKIKKAEENGLESLI